VLRLGRINSNGDAALYDGASNWLPDISNWPFSPRICGFRKFFANGMREFAEAAFRG
jgi:hypothetical protein